MPDLTMCPGTKCPQKDDCYRHTAEPSPTGRQSYFLAPPLKPDGGCNYYWPSPTPKSPKGT